MRDINKIGSTNLNQEELLLFVNNVNASSTKYPKDKTLGYLFERQVGINPESTAVRFMDISLSYKELNIKVNKLANYLSQFNITPESLIAVGLERSLDYIITILAIIKLGAAYVPIDVHSPQERMQLILRDTAAPILMTVSLNKDFFGGYEGRLIELDKISEALEQQKKLNPTSAITSSNLAYVLYTSGSTGKPKGVMIEHKSIIRLVKNTNYIVIKSEDKMAHVANIVFDASTFEIWGALLNGACLTIVPNGISLSTKKFEDFLKHEKISILLLTTGVLNKIVAEDPNIFCGINYLLAGGEALNSIVISKLLSCDHPPKNLINGYGPTESTTFATSYKFPKTWDKNKPVPIGKPISNTQVYILKNDLRLVDIGETGELYIAGDGLARGYLNNLDLTEKRFIDNLFDKTAKTKLYKSGDLAQWAPDGNIEFLGREDRQVKLRGFRIELDEIENTLKCSGYVQDVIVILQESPVTQLIAYVLKPQGKRFAESKNEYIKTLRDYLQRFLPNYMLPTAYVVLQHFPINSNGKIDKRALPSPDKESYIIDAHYVAPKTHIEREIAKLWSNALGITDIGINDNFLQLGGHSLMLTNIVAKLQEKYGVGISFMQFFENPTISGIAKIIQSGGDKKTNKLPPIPNKSGKEWKFPNCYPLSFAQERLWILDQILPNKAVYNIPIIFQFHGNLDKDILQKALDALVLRHEILRTNFKVEDSEAVQVAKSIAKIELKGCDLSKNTKASKNKKMEEIIRLASEHVFDLSKDTLFIGYLCKLSHEYFNFIFVIHHIIFDGWSVKIFLRELIDLYNHYKFGKKLNLPKLKAQYVSFAVWQKHLINDGIFDRQINYWKTQLENIPEKSSLYTDRERPNKQTYLGNSLHVFISRDKLEKIKNFSRYNDCTLFVALFTVFAVLIHRYSNQDDLVIGIPSANRHYPGVENLIGFFVNSIALRVNCVDNLSFSELLKQVKNTVLTAFSNQDVPFEKMVQNLNIRRDLKQHPIFQIMFVLQEDFKLSIESAEAINVSVIEGDSKFSKFDLTVTAREMEGGLDLKFEYAVDLFESATIARFSDHFIRLIDIFINDPSIRIRDAKFITSNESNQILKTFIAGEPVFKKCYGNRTIHELFEEQVKQHPHATAVIDGGQSITYAELNHRANQLACMIKIKRANFETVKGNFIVGLLLERSVDMIVGMLSILKAGGAYLPLDDSYPEERISYMLKDANVRIVVGQKKTLEKFKCLSDNIDYTCIDCSAVTEQSSFKNSAVFSNNPDCINMPTDLAYVIYTSGSTGLPKGVCISHYAVANLAVNSNFISINPTDRIAQLANHSFDAATFEIWGALLNGAATVIIPQKVIYSPGQLKNIIINNNITIAFVTTALFNFLAEKNLEILYLLRILLFGGEEANFERVYSVLEHKPENFHLIHVYGPTEATTYASYCYLDKQLIKDNTIPIGRALSGKLLYVLDDLLNLAPIGIPGELYIGGDGLAIGYLNNPVLTTERFIQNPFATKDDLDKKYTRLYKTGDLVRWRADGNLVFIGRTDNQVKIRGFRIEVGEVENSIIKYPAIKNCIVVVKKDSTDNKCLSAYLILKSHTQLNWDALRSYLKSNIPQYMIPAEFTVVDSFPLNSSGKIDKAKLITYSKLKADIPTKDDFIAKPIIDKKDDEKDIGSDNKQKSQQDHILPSMDYQQIEKVIIKILKELLSRDAIDTGSNFFDIGMHSLMVIHACRKLNAEINIILQPVDLFSYPTIRKLAEFISQQQSIKDSCIRNSFVKKEVTEKPNLVNVKDHIAVIGLSCRLPGANNPEEYWSNLQNGEEKITRFTISSGSQLEADETYVPARGIIKGIEMFDANFFNFSPYEASITEPQQRLFLEVAWEALEDAGYSTDKFSGKIGVYAGSTDSTYLVNNLQKNSTYWKSQNFWQTLIATGSAFLSTKTAYKLDFKGPALNITTACSSSLVSIALACKQLQQGICDMAIAGGASIDVPQEVGYIYQEGGIPSPDGHCRPFAADAAGTVPANGVGAVVLKRLSDAIADSDHIEAIIVASSINNDGSDKVAFTAPSVFSQAECIKDALEIGNVDPESISYVEAHGTATPLGDPIEIAALTKAYRYKTSKKQYCALGSVKGNIGHTNAAAGVAGFIKVILALKNEKIPASLFFDHPNPEIDFTNSPFYVNTSLKNWTVESGNYKRAAVSSFGLGGTNAHVILQEAPKPIHQGSERALKLLMISAKTEKALEEYSEKLRCYLEAQVKQTNSKVKLSDIAYTLQTGRRDFAHRRVIKCEELKDAIDILKNKSLLKANTKKITELQKPSLVFMFSGQGSQYVNMGLSLYQTEKIFRDTIDACARELSPLINLDIRDILFPKEGKKGKQEKLLRQTRYAQPILFSFEYALAQFYLELGIAPDYMLGHSIGEYVAACIAGVFSLQDALKIVAYRGKLIHELRNGSMLSVPLAENDVRPLIDGKSDISLAAINSSNLLVVSGENKAILGFQKELNKKYPDIKTTVLKTSHAFHSFMMEPILAKFDRFIAQIDSHPVQKPFFSNLTGRIFSVGDKIECDYWVRHIRSAVNFATSIEWLLINNCNIFLELGPGNTLTTFVRQHNCYAEHKPMLVFNALPHPKEFEDDPNATLRQAHSLIANLWLNGYLINWGKYYNGEKRQKVALPTYPFQREKHWIAADQTDTPKIYLEKNKNVNDWFYELSWKRLDVLQNRIFNKNILTGKECVIIFSQDDVDVKYVKEHFSDVKSEVIVIKQARNFKQKTSNYFEINPNQKTDYERLFETYGQGKFDCFRIIHLWNISPVAENNLTYDELLKCANLAFYQLLFMFQSCVAKLSVRINVTIVANHATKVLGNDIINPIKALLIGLSRVVPQEHEQISSRFLDLGEICKVDNTVLRQIIIDSFIEKEDKKTDVYAYREGYLWRECLSAKQLTGIFHNTMKLRPKGVYLITGGLGGIGLAIAKYLAEKTAANLVFVSRTKFPCETEWQSLIGGNGSENDLSKKIKELEKIKKNGSKMLFLNADVSDEKSMSAVIKEIVKQFGQLNGVIHAAGIAGGGVVSLKSIEQIEKVFLPKVQGTLVLGKLLENTPLDFFIICSSLISAIGAPGQSDYCAANAFLDNFAISNRLHPSAFVCSIGWNGWQEVGMAAQAVGQGFVKEIGGGNSISPEQGIRVFERILQGNLNHVLVSIYKPGEYLDSLLKQAFSDPAEELNLINNKNEFKDEIETKLAQLFINLLKVKEINAEDDFFELGGHSLIALQLISDIRKCFVIKIALADIYKLRTIRAMADFIRKPKNIAGKFSTIVTLRSTGNKRPLFLIHPAGGTTFCYLSLVKYIDCNRPIYAIQDPGLESNDFHFSTLEQMAEAYLQEIKTIQQDGPYLLGGLSYGGVIAFEMAQQLLMKKEEIEFLGLIDSWSLFSDKFQDRKFFEQTLQHQQKNLELKIGNNSSEFMQRWFDLQWERMQLLFKYKPKVLSKKIHLFKATEILPEYRPIDEMCNHWQRYTDQSIELYKIPGSHDTIIKEPNVVDLAQYLNESLTKIN